MKRVLVFGSRDWMFRDHIHTDMINLGMLIGPYVVVHGACPNGADYFASSGAHLMAAQQERYPADWKEYGKAAGPIRNREMAMSEPDYALGYIINSSPGSENMLQNLEARNVPYKVTRMETFRTFGFPKEI